MKTAKPCRHSDVYVFSQVIFQDIIGVQTQVAWCMHCGAHEMAKLIGKPGPKAKVSRRWVQPQRRNRATRQERR